MTWTNVQYNELEQEEGLYYMAHSWIAVFVGLFEYKYDGHDMDVATDKIARLV